MEKLAQWRGVLEKTFSQTERFETYDTDTQFNRFGPPELVPVEELKELAQDYFNILREDIIKGTKDSEQEIKRIEASFTLEYYLLEVPYTIKSKGAIKGQGVEKYRYPFAQLKNDLQRGVIKAHKEGGAQIVSHLLATLNYFDWLRGNLRGSIENEPEEFVQLWVNPERDIPIIREIFKALEYIDETEVWDIARFKNPWGPIHAIIQFPSQTIIGNHSKKELLRVFGERFSFDGEKRQQERYSFYEDTFKETTSRLYQSY
jgi:hypothetical protein